MSPAGSQDPALHTARALGVIAVLAPWHKRRSWRIVLAPHVVLYCSSSGATSRRAVYATASESSPA